LGGEGNAVCAEIGDGRKRLNTECAEKEHRVHREEVGYLMGLGGK
jgi:hypothetical protein